MARRHVNVVTFLVEPVKKAVARWWNFARAEGELNGINLPDVRLLERIARIRSARRLLENNGMTTEEIDRWLQLRLL